MKRVAALVTVGLLWSATSAASPWFGGGGIERGTTSLDIPATIRVRLVQSHKTITLHWGGTCDYVLLRGGKVYSGRGDLIAQASHGGVHFGGTDFPAAVLVATVNPRDHLSVGGRRYRGAMIVAPVGGKELQVIEQIDFEE